MTTFSAADKCNPPSGTGFRSEYQIWKIRARFTDSVAGCTPISTNPPGENYFMTTKSIIAIAALLAANASMAGDITWNQGGDTTLGSFVSTGVTDDIFGWWGGVGLDAGGTAVFVTGTGITNVTLDGAAFTFTPHNAT